MALRLLPIALPKLTIKIQKLKFVCSLLGVFGGYCSAVFFKSIFTLGCKRKILVFLFLKCFTPRPNLKKKEMKNATLMVTHDLVKGQGTCIKGVLKGYY